MNLSVSSLLLLLFSFTNLQNHVSANIDDVPSLDDLNDELCFHSKERVRSLFEQPTRRESRMANACERVGTERLVNNRRIVDSDSRISKFPTRYNKIPSIRITREERITSERFRRIESPFERDSDVRRVVRDETISRRMVQPTTRRDFRNLEQRQSIREERTRSFSPENLRQTRDLNRQNVEKYIRDERILVRNTRREVPNSVERITISRSHSLPSLTSRREIRNVEERNSRFSRNAREEMTRRVSNSEERRFERVAERESSRRVARNSEEQRVRLTGNSARRDSLERVVRNAEERRIQNSQERVRTSSNFERVNLERVVRNSEERREISQERARLSRNFKREDLRQVVRNSEERRLALERVQSLRSSTTKSDRQSRVRDAREETYRVSRDERRTQERQERARENRALPLQRTQSLRNFVTRNDRQSRVRDEREEMSRVVRDERRTQERQERAREIRDLPLQRTQSLRSFATGNDRQSRVRDEREEMSRVVRDERRTQERQERAREIRALTGNNLRSGVRNKREEMSRVSRNERSTLNRQERSRDVRVSERHLEIPSERVERRSLERNVADSRNVQHSKRDVNISENRATRIENIRRESRERVASSQERRLERRIAPTRETTEIRHQVGTSENRIREERDFSDARRQISERRVESRQERVQVARDLDERRVQMSRERQPTDASFTRQAAERRNIREREDNTRRLNSENRMARSLSEKQTLKDENNNNLHSERRQERLFFRTAFEEGRSKQGVLETQGLVAWSNNFITTIMGVAILTHILSTSSNSKKSPLQYFTNLFTSYKEKVL